MDSPSGLNIGCPKATTRLRQFVLDKRRCHVPRLTLSTSSVLFSLQEGSIVSLLSWTCAFLLPCLPRSDPRALSGDRPARRTHIDRKVCDLRTTRSAFPASPCKSHPRRVSPIRRICLYFELAVIFCFVEHDGLSSGNPTPSTASTHLHPRRRQFKRLGNLTFLRFIHVPNAFSNLPLV